MIVDKVVIIYRSDFIIGVNVCVRAADFATPCPLKVRGHVVQPILLRARACLCECVVCVFSARVC